MQVNPQYNAVGTFFSDKAVFIVPVYQRSYAWEKEEIDDFLKDLEKVFYARKAGKPKIHFLGSIITVEYPLQGVANETSWGKAEILQRTDKLKEMALKIFKML